MFLRHAAARRDIPALPLNKTRFTEFLIRGNAPSACGLKEWIFSPGMLFNATDTWWGDCKKRDRPHEGIDICLYRDTDGTTRRLGIETRIPVMYTGMVKGIITDFLGTSVLIEHRFSDDTEKILVTIYGHIQPVAGLLTGDRVEEGDIIGTLAGTRISRSGIPPHLHLSLGRASGKPRYDSLDWNMLAERTILTFLDPLEGIDYPYSVVAQNLISRETDW